MATVAGAKILGELDGALGTLRREVHSIDDAIGRSAGQVERLGTEKLMLYRKLAEHHLARVERGEMVRGLDTVSRDIQTLLEQRSASHRALLERITEQETALASLEREREAARLEVETAAAALDEREAEVQARLERDEQYTAQFERAREADAVALHAEEKTRDAADDKAAKGAPYESDRLFMYLWGRHYGTSEYSANPLARLLDGWVARLIGYQKARPNYWMLNQIPERLRAHAESARASATAEFEKLKALEAAARDEMGVGELERELDAREQSLAEHDAAIEGLEHRLADLDAERTRFAAGEDELMAMALERLSAEFESDGVATLMRRAALTPGPDDDLLVRQIADIDARLQMIIEELDDQRKLQGRRAGKLRELEQVRRQFKQRGFDDLRSVFSNGGAVAAGVRQFLSGLLEDDDLWRLIARAHRTRRVQARPDFGSGGFPPLPGSWRAPRGRPPIGSLPRPTPGSLRFPTGGGLRRRRGGGGFSTGGGF
jgi:hypothetical protein